MKTQLNISGMHCASCAGKIEKALKSVLGVKNATVNFATEKATVDTGDQNVDQGLLVKAVESIGYKATPPPQSSPRVAEGGSSPHSLVGEHDHTAMLKEQELRQLKEKVIWCILGSAVVMIGSFVSWPYANITLLLVTTPILFWGGAMFFKGAWSALKHGTTSMDTLVALGTLAAYSYSVVITFTSQDGGTYLIPQLLLSL